MNKILITGANGFVGKYLCEKASNNERLIRAAVRKPENISYIQNIETAAIYKIDLKTNWVKALESIDTIVHLAARAHIIHDKSSDPLASFRETNTDGTARLASEAARLGVKRFIYISSVKVHGEGSLDNNMFYTEDKKPIPVDPYAISKFEAEEALKQIAADTGMEIVIIRPPLVYGPNVKANFLRLIAITKKLMDFGMPNPFGAFNNKRSMIYVGNLVDAIIVCLTHPKAAGETFLIRDGQDVSTTELVKQIASSFGTKNYFLPIPMNFFKYLFKITGRNDDMLRLFGSLRVVDSKIRKTLGWLPPYTFEQGVEDTIKHYKGLTDEIH